MNGRPHKLKCEAMRVNTLPSAVSAPFSSADVSKSANHINSSPVKNEENCPFANNGGESLADASNVPLKDEVIVHDDNSKQSVTENLLKPVASTSQMLAAGANNTHGQMNTQVYRRTIVIGVDGNQIPSNKGVEPKPIEIGPGKRCDICNVRHLPFICNLSDCVLNNNFNFRTGANAWIRRQLRRTFKGQTAPVQQ